MAPCVIASPWWFVPVTRLTVPNPVWEVVGYDPTSPLIVVSPVLVMPVPARTAKLPAVPRSTGVGPAAFTICPPASMPIARVTEMPAENSNLAPWIRLFILPSPSCEDCPSVPVPDRRSPGLVGTNCPVDVIDCHGFLPCTQASRETEDLKATTGTRVSRCSPVTLYRIWRRPRG